MTRTLALRLSPLALLAIPFGCARPTPPPEEAPPAPVVAVPPKEETLGEWSELLGATQPLPNHAARVTAAVEGRVLWLLRDPAAGSEKETRAEGQEVRQGQVIGKLDDRVARANRDKVAAGHEEVKEQLRQAGLAVQTARLDVNRLEKLQSGGKGDTPLVARVEVDKARIALKDAESKREALTARLAAGKAELKALDEQLDLYTLRAPLAGRLGTLHAVPGQTLAVGALVAEIVDLREIDVVCSVPPHTAAKLALGQPARLVKNDGSGPRGQVTYIAVQAQPETGNFVVKARFPNPDLKLRSNTVLRVEALTEPEKPRLTIPADALLEDEEPPAVVVVLAKEVKEEEHEGHKEKIGKALKLRAKVGVRDRQHGQVEILGLEDPDKKQAVSPRDVLFIKKGAHGLHTGDEVKLEEEGEKKED